MRDKNGSLVVLTVINVSSQWNKPELDSGYLVNEWYNRTGDLLFLLPFCKTNIVVYLTNQGHAVFYLDKVSYLVFYNGMILGRH